MWIFTSKGRPDLIQRTIRSYAWGGESQVILALCAGDPRLGEYVSQQWPAGWVIVPVPMSGNGPTYNEILRMYPDEPNYGFLADDTLLDTPGMLRDLEVAAGDWNVAYANDQHHGPAIPTMPCIGGELVRAVGYLGPPNIPHWGLDCCWYDIGRKTDGLAYRPDLIYTHLNPCFNTAPDDKTYSDARTASWGYHDHYRGWLHGGEFKRAITRVRNLKYPETAAKVG